MKKVFYLLIMSFILVSCGSYKSLDLNKLSTGMTKMQVQTAIGAPDRVLAVNRKADGYQEILEYRTSRDEVYALEFWDDYLTGYEFLYDDINYTNYVAPMYRPSTFPAYGRPIIVVSGNNKPNRPNRPRPTQPNRPTQPSRPGNSTRPVERPTPTTRPVENNKSNMLR